MVEVVDDDGIVTKMDKTIFEVDDPDIIEEGDSIWTEVASDCDELFVDTESIKMLTKPIIEIKPFKKWRKIISLLTIILLVSFLAYLDYVNDFQIMHLINTFQFSKKASAKGVAICSPDGDLSTIPGIIKVEAVVHMIEKDSLWALSSYLKSSESDRVG